MIPDHEESVTPQAVEFVTFRSRPSDEPTRKMTHGPGAGKRSAKSHARTPTEQLKAAIAPRVVETVGGSVGSLFLRDNKRELCRT